jgi:hypothetical protein
LHDRTVRQPIEFFHSSLYALYHGARLSLWDIHGRTRTTGPLQPECQTCEFELHCNGFFKSPRADYPCDGVKEVLGKLTEAATELRSL